MEDSTFEFKTWNCIIFKEEALSLFLTLSNGIAHDLLVKAMKSALDWISQNNITNFKISHDTSVFNGGVYVSVVIVYLNN
jgi:hypothetical protein